MKKVQKDPPKKKPKEEAAPQNDEEASKKMEVKVQKIEENICQWIDEETKSLKNTLEHDITSIRSEVDNKNIEMNSKVQGSIHELRDIINTKVADLEAKLNNMDISDNDNVMTITNGDTGDNDLGWVRAVLDLKNKMHKNCNTLRFLCSEPLSVQWSVWYKGDFTLEKGVSEDIVPFNWVNCNVGGAVEDGKIIFRN